jgi:hypothetical protein
MGATLHVIPNEAVISERSQPHVIPTPSVARGRNLALILVPKVAGVVQGKTQNRARFLAPLRSAALRSE